MMRYMDVGRLLIAVSTAVFALGVCSCAHSKNIQEFPEPWQVLDPGKPLEKFPRIEILEQGGGAIIEPGGLVQLHIRNQSHQKNTEYDDGAWWIWIGFRSREETSFFSNEPGVASALIGLQEGTLLKFVSTERGRSNAGKLRHNAFGDNDYYSWRKMTHEFSNIYTPTSSGSSSVEIKRVCKGQAQYRTVRLFDDSPVEVCSGLRCYMSHDPSEAWFDEAKIEAICQDGRKVKFEYGPTDSYSGGTGRSPVIGYFDRWISDAWQRIPRGVQFVGNRPPVAERDRFTVQENSPTRIDVLANDSDPDKDRLTVRILNPPSHGTLIPNADGSLTYTPTDDCLADEFTYKASDGLIESDVADVHIHIVREKPYDSATAKKCASH